jgi:tetratricopeptide (TPR) repeat protein
VTNRTSSDDRESPIKQLEIQKRQFENALTHLQSGNAEMAAEMCELSLEKFPGDANLLCLSARANIMMRKFAVAESRVLEAIRMFPDFSQAHEIYGDLQILLGRPRDAIQSYEQAMRLDPARALVHDKIERARQLEADHPEVTRRPARPRMPFADEIEKAAQYRREDDPRSAEMIYRDILTKDPNHVEAARLLAEIAETKKRYSDAEILLKRVVQNAPDYVRAWVDLVKVQCDLNKFDDAIDSSKKVLRLEPDTSESYILYARTIGMAGRHEEAIDAYKKALQLAPDRAGAACGMAHHQKTIGQQDNAIASYRHAIAIKPDHAEAYWSLANLKTFQFEEAEIAAMESLLDDEDLPDESRSQLHNALGLHFEARRKYDRAFSHFRECNKYRRMLENYDPVKTEDTYGRIIGMFTPEFLAQRQSIPDAEVTPILVVGLPRSGSTLIEQILASHSQVDGTHELGDLARSVQTARRRPQRDLRFPEGLSKLSDEDWRELGRRYIESTRIHRGTAPFFVDKNPNNFIYTGVLRIALPNAKIIDARRHPLDSCFGSYKQLFASGQPFTYDLTELGEYYAQYRRLMDHWRQVLPGFVLEVQYEDVVADLETQVRRILDFCGLPFEENCLKFHETERAVKTASSEQVRRPIYSTSVNLWRNYEPYLEELVHILEPLLRDMPEEDRPYSLPK